MTNYVVYSGSIPTYVIDQAKGILAGGYSDYWLACTDENTYTLCACNAWSDGAEECDIYTWVYYRPDQQSFNYTYQFSWRQDAVYVTNPYSFAFYSSADHTPGLRDGGDIYAFHEICLLVFGFCFCIVCHIFRNLFR